MWRSDMIIPSDKFCFRQTLVPTNSALNSNEHYRAIQGNQAIMTEGPNNRNRLLGIYQHIQVFTWLSTALAILRNSFFITDLWSKLEGLFCFLVFVVASNTESFPLGWIVTVLLFANPNIKHPWIRHRHSTLNFTLRFCATYLNSGT